jgi:hypothetical protein
MGSKQTFAYFLPRSVVQISGLRRETIDELTSGQETIELEAAVECVEQADPDWPLRIAMDRTFFRDQEGSLGFTVDRRLSSLSAASTGTASKLASGAFRFVTSTIAAAVPLVTGTGAAFDDESEPDTIDPEQQYADECKAAAKDRADLHEAIVATRSAIVQATRDAATGKDTSKQLRTLLHAMEVLQELQAKADLHFAAWRATKKKTRTQDLMFEVPILSLPKTREIADKLGQLDAKLLGPCWEPFKRLGVLVSVETAAQTPTDGPKPGATSAGFYFRSPRVVWLSLYKRSEESEPPQLVERRKQLVYDASCPTEFVSCESGTWNKRTVTAQFDTGSALSKISIASQGGATAIGEALADAVDQAKKGLADAEAVNKSLDTIRDHDIDRQLTLLEKRKQIVEAELARDAAAADLTSLRELAQLNHKKELLTARDEVAALEKPLAAERAPTNGADAASAIRIVVSLES